MSYWQIREICELGKEGRLFTLTKDQPLTIGQNDNSTIQLKLRTIEKKHAVVEWSNKKLSYIVRDLGSISGTFVNNAPLTRGTEELRHGDSLRFGHEKSHVFRVEENLKPVQTKAVTSSSLQPISTATQTSPQGNQILMSPSVTINPPITTSVPSTTSIPSPQTTAQLTPLLPQGIILQSGGYFVSGGQQGTILTPGAPLQYIIPQASGVVSPGFIQPLQSSIPMATPVHPSTPPPSSSVFVGEATPTVMPVQNVETESIVDDLLASSKRTDGRRQVELSNTPSLATTSRLYGQPAWWGEEARTYPPADSAYQYVSPKGQILRDLESDSWEETSSVSSRSSKLSMKDELRLKAISNSQEQSSSTSSWVVDFGSSSKPHRNKPRPRSAEISPVRARPTESGRASSVTPGPALSRKTQSTFIKHRSSVGSNEGGSKTVTKRPYNSSSLTRSATTRKTTLGSPKLVRKTSLDSKTRRKSGSLSDLNTKTGSEAENIHTKKNDKHSTRDSKSRKKSGSTSGKTDKIQTHSVVDKNQDSKPHRKSGSTTGYKSSATSDDVSEKAESHTMVDKTYTKIGGQGSSDDLQTSLSDLSLTSYTEPVVVKDKFELKSASDSCVGSEGVEQSIEGVGGSARKKWTKEQQQSPDSLMLANIEARLRQLSRLAQGAAVKLSSLQRGLQVRGLVRTEETSHIRPFSPSREQRVPQWKFSQTKEVHGIFLSMKSVEKWLNDIDFTVAAMRLLPHEGVAEGVDYETPESEMEHYHDSIEDNFGSCSESNYSDEQ